MRALRVSSALPLFALLLFVVSSLATPRPALAEPLPTFLPPPPGLAFGATTYHRYDFLEIPGSATPGASQGPPTGHRWLVQLTGATAAYRVSAWRPALEHAGWQVLSDSGMLLARHDAPEGPVWLKQTRGEAFELLATAPQPTLALPAPGATPETPSAGHDLPWLLPVPGFTQTRFEASARPEEMTGPLTGGPFYVNAPVWRFEYRGGPEVAEFELQTVYTAALRAAGWAINVANRGGITTAHYAQHGRDVWVKVTPGVGSVQFAVGDIGAASSAARLRAALDTAGHVALYGIYFDTDRDVLRPDSEATLQQILALLREAPALRVEVQGHTDNAGTPAHNQPLSEARAASVRRWLTEHGVAAARLTSAGYGERQPVGDNTTAQGRALNRRVELSRLR